MSPLFVHVSLFPQIKFYISLQSPAYNLLKPPHFKQFNADPPFPSVAPNNGSLHTSHVFGCGGVVFLEAFDSDIKYNLVTGQSLVLSSSPETICVRIIVDANADAGVWSFLV
jgi:hypothetical protein